MDIELGLPTITADNQRGGRVKYLVLDPATARVKSAVIEWGMVLRHDVEVPIDMLSREDTSTVRIHLVEEALKNRPAFDPSYYEAPPPEAAGYLGMPMSGLLWPTANPAATYAPGFYPAISPREDGSLEENSERHELWERMDRENALIETGSEVIDANGERAGSVHDIAFDSATGKISRLVMTRGALFAEHVDVPPTAIARADDGVVYLNVTSSQLAAMPREQETRDY